MNVPDPFASPIETGRVGLFLWGLLMRLAYGLLALPLLALVRPDMFTEAPSPLIFAGIFYLFICTGGGM